MHYAPVILCVLGVGGVAFGVWGMKSEQGRRLFDEMAGMIPVGVGFLGAVFIAVGLIWLLFRYFYR